MPAPKKTKEERDRERLEKQKQRDAEFKEYYEENENFKFVADLYFESKKILERGGKLMLRRTVCIPSCRNRKPSLLDTLNEVGSKVNVFIYADEVKLYEWLEETDMLHKVVVPVDYHTVQKMRFFIQGYMKDEAFWLLDDDLIGASFCRKLKSSSVFQAIWAADEIVEHEHALDTLASIQANMCDINAKVWEGKTLIRGAEFNHQAVLYNAPMLNKHGIHFTGDTSVNEDTEMSIDVLRAGCKMGAVEGINIVPIMDTKLSIASSKEKQLKYVMDGYMKFGNYCKLDIKETDKNIQVHVNRKECEVRRELPPRYDGKIYDLCLERDFDDLYDFLLKVKNEEETLELPPIRENAKDIVRTKPLF